MVKLNIPGNIHFVTARTYNRQPIFNKDKCCEIFLDNLAIYRNKFKFKIYAYVIMPDHVHMLIYPNYTPLRVSPNSFGAELREKTPNEFGVTPKESNISYILKNIKGCSAREINKYLNGEGSIWLKGFYDFNIFSDQKFEEKLSYIHQNPLKAGLVTDISEYKYCSWRNYNHEDNTIFQIDYYEF